MKTSLIVFHALNCGICLFGLAILILGIVSGLSECVLGSDGADRIMRQVDFFIAALGFAMILMSFMGYVGTVWKTEVTECRGIIYASALFVLFWALISAGSFVLHYSYKFRTIMNINIERNMFYYWNTRKPGIVERQAYIDKIQRTLKCCGFYDKSIYPKVPKNGLPESCCEVSMLDENGECTEKKAFEGGCFGKGSMALENANFMLGIIVTVTAGFTLSAVIFNIIRKRTVWQSLKTKVNKNSIGPLTEH